MVRTRLTTVRVWLSGSLSLCEELGGAEPDAGALVDVEVVGQRVGTAGRAGAGVDPHRRRAGGRQPGAVLDRVGDRFLAGESGVGGVVDSGWTRSEDGAVGGGRTTSTTLKLSPSGSKSLPSTFTATCVPAFVRATSVTSHGSGRGVGSRTRDRDRREHGRQGDDHCDDWGDAGRAGACRPPPESRCVRLHSRLPSARCGMVTLACRNPESERSIGYLLEIDRGQRSGPHEQRDSRLGPDEFRVVWEAARATNSKAPPEVQGTVLEACGSFTT